MLIEHPPRWYRSLFPKAWWRLPGNEGQKRVFLTFDDGPIPEVTPWVLDLLRHENIKATFFCVADNVRKYPEVFQQVLAGGHHIGNHTYHHLQGLYCSVNRYITDALQAKTLLPTPLFRPPHGHMRWMQYRKLQEQFQVVMWDVVTRDYSSRVTPNQVLHNVERYTQNGSIIVFHDSLKAEKNLRYALPRAINYLKENGYTFEAIPYLTP